MLRGLRVTVTAILGGFLIALVVGLLLELGRRSPFRVIRLVCHGYIWRADCRSHYGWKVILCDVSKMPLLSYISFSSSTSLT
jgi:hypothetical protein